MTTVPTIGPIARTVRGIRMELTIPPDLRYFQGHFPECALLPGVVQVAWAIEFGRRHLEFEGAFRGLTGLKFMRVIQPGCKVVLELEYELASRRLEFAYESAAGRCSRGTAQF
jgi:3-hydroxymyristoyl/3-hydroxydecanoyl-(acyl carrier protein) dehydratase